jgi:pimeloyl-ACP methyl ester carboxylesterase
MAERENIVASREYRVQASGLSLRVKEWGDASAAPIVMLHGIRGYAETFAALAQTLQPAFRVIAFDQRGRGESDWDPGRNYYTDAYVDDVNAVVNHLALDQFDLLGHSMGGINAIAYSAFHPARVRRLVIEDAGPGAFEVSAGATRIRKEFATTPAEFASWDAASDFLRALRPTVPEAARQQRLQHMLKPAPGGGFTWRYDHAGIAQTRLNPDPLRVVDLAPLVQRISCPTLVIRGGKSDYLQPEMVAAMQALNPRIQAADIADAGHYVHDDQPVAFAAVVARFLGLETRNND